LSLRLSLLSGHLEGRSVGARSTLSSRALGPRTGVRGPFIPRYAPRRARSLTLSTRRTGPPRMSLCSAIQRGRIPPGSSFSNRDVGQPRFEPRRSSHHDHTWLTLFGCIEYRLQPRGMPLMMPLMRSRVIAKIIARVGALLLSSQLGLAQLAQQGHKLTPHDAIGPSGSRHIFGCRGVGRR
jgi:hypothetical protein